MPIREVAALACKIFGLYTIVTATVDLFGALIFAADQNALSFAAGQKILSVAPYILLLIFGLLLWLFADKLATFMVRNRKPTKVLPINISVEDLQIMAFSVLGLFFLGDGLPKLVSYIITIAAVPGTMEQMSKSLYNSNLANMVEVIIQIALGLGMFFGSRGLSGFLNGLRKAGVKDM